jgi:HlyD family secretion protein
MRSTQSMVALLTVVALVLAGCGGEGVASGTPLPTVVLGRAGAPTAAQAQPRRGGVTASAVVAPVEQLALTAGVAGRIAEVRVVEGERVTAGQVLVALDDGAAQAQVAEAEAALAAAQAELDLLTAGPTPEELRQAEAAVASAQAALAALQAGARAEQVAQAEANLVAAQAALALLQRGATDLELQAAQIALEEAEGARWAAQGSRDATCGGASSGSAACAAAEGQVLAAEARVRQAENRLAQLRQGPAPETVAQAQQAVRAAEAALALTREPGTPEEVAAAQAQVDAAAAALDALRAGPRAERLAAARARVAQAEAGVEAAQAQLGALTLTAPIDGTVIDLTAHAGQWVIPGQTLGLLADLESLVVETTDLSELDVLQVAVGGPATVTIEALGVEVRGVVQAIAPLADTLGGDVVYRVTVGLEAQPDGLRAGMSAVVGF